MPQPSATVNSRSSATLVSAAVIIARSGVRLSPSARSILDKRLYAIDMGMPEKYMRRYSSAPGSTLSGVLSMLSVGSRKIWLIASVSTATSADSSMDMAMLFLSPS